MSYCEVVRPDEPAAQVGDCCTGLEWKGRDLLKHGYLLIYLWKNKLLSFSLVCSLFFLFSLLVYFLNVFSQNTFIKVNLFLMDQVFSFQIERLGSVPIKEVIIALKLIYPFVWILVMLQCFPTTSGPDQVNHQAC